MNQFNSFSNSMMNIDEVVRHQKAYNMMHRSLGEKQAFRHLGSGRTRYTQSAERYGDSFDQRAPVSLCPMMTSAYCKACCLWQNCVLESQRDVNWSFFGPAWLTQSGSQGVVPLSISGGRSLTTAPLNLVVHVPRRINIEANLQKLSLVACTGSMGTARPSSFHSLPLLPGMLSAA